MKFGADIHAHTGFDETVYKIIIPADDPDMLETGLTILKECAFEIAFEKEELDKERGVVVEEWRSGRGADARMRERYYVIISVGYRAKSPQVTKFRQWATKLKIVEKAKFVY